jgi:hypothetical protein
MKITVLLSALSNLINSETSVFDAAVTADYSPNFQDLLASVKY